MSSLKVTAIIPARMAASRYPGKPLVKILGLEMIEHVRRRVERMKGLHQVFVATCDQEIKAVVERHGGKVIMTANTHERATDRIEEAARSLDADVVINVQGDEPMVSQEAIEKVISPFYTNDAVRCSCLVYPIQDLADLSDDNVVKCVLSRSGRILYLSREKIPGRKTSSSTTYYQQSGIMAFRKEMLHTFTKLKPTPLEAKESVDILRLLENDYWVQAVEFSGQNKLVDVPDQVKTVEDAILGDPEQKKIFESIR